MKCKVYGCQRGAEMVVRDEHFCLEHGAELQVLLSKTYKNWLKDKTGGKVIIGIAGK